MLIRVVWYPNTVNTKTRGKCVITGCGKPHLAKGWCSAHYSLQRRYGRLYKITGSGPEIVGPYAQRPPHLRRVEYVTLTCPACGKTKEVPPCWSRRRFCNNYCQARFQRSSATTCPECGVQFCRLRGTGTPKNRLYCSVECGAKAKFRIICRTKPTKPEVALGLLLGSLGYTYTGNGERVVANKCPDFIHKSEPKVVEMFGDYWHKGENPQDRINLFAQHGYRTAIIWEHELSDPDAILEKVRAL